MTLRVGIIGGAGHVNTVVQGLDELEDAVLCAVAKGCPEEDMAVIRKRSKADESTPAYEDYRRMLEKEKPDIVAVSPFYYLHAEVACEALRRGVPVFCEKPLALTLEQLEEVRRVQQEGNTPLGMMLGFRYSPAFWKARKLVRSGAIGQPTVGYSQKSYIRGQRPDFYRRRETFGGIIPWVGIHAIDWFRWVSGRRYTAVTARHVKLHYPDYPGMEDAATCLFELDNGGSAVMSFDFLRPAGAPTHGDDRLRLLGEKGAIEVRGSDWLELITPEGVERVRTEPPAHGMFADFAMSVIHTDHTPLITSAEAIEVTEIALKVRQAADTGTRMPL